MSGPEKGWFGGYITTEQNLGAGTSAWSPTTGRASHSPLYYSYSSSHWNVEGWMVCLRIPILRRMRCGGKNYPPNLPPRH